MKVRGSKFGEAETKRSCCVWRLVWDVILDTEGYGVSKPHEDRRKKE